MNPSTALQDYIAYQNGSESVEELAARNGVSVEDMFEHLFIGKERFQGA